MSTPDLLGPIQTGSSFMIVSIQNNIPYILNGATSNKEIIYYWESDLEVITKGTKLGIFTAQFSDADIIINDNINNGGIEFMSDGVTIGNGPQPSKLVFKQEDYANWWPPNVFLSKVEYSIFNYSNQIGQIKTSPGSSGSAPIEANNIMILPVWWYYGCTSSGSYEYINDPIDSVINWFCLVNPSMSTCSSKKIIPSGWTNFGDCSVGNYYSYCLTGFFCGDSSCKGPCPKEYYDCDYNSGGYTCKFDANKYITESDWWKSPIFIVSIVGLIILVLLFIGIAIFLVVKSKKRGRYIPVN